MFSRRLTFLTIQFCFSLCITYSVAGTCENGTLKLSLFGFRNATGNWNLFYDFDSEVCESTNSWRLDLIQNWNIERRIRLNGSLRENVPESDLKNAKPIHFSGSNKTETIFISNKEIKETERETNVIPVPEAIPPPYHTPTTELGGKLLLEVAAVSETGDITYKPSDSLEKSEPIIINVPTKKSEDDTSVYGMLESSSTSQKQTTTDINEQPLDSLKEEVATEFETEIPDIKGIDNFVTEPTKSYREDLTTNSTFTSIIQRNESMEISKVYPNRKFTEKNSSETILVNATKSSDLLTYVSHNLDGGLTERQTLVSGMRTDEEYPAVIVEESPEYTITDETRKTLEYNATVVIEGIKSCTEQTFDDKAKLKIITRTEWKAQDSTKKFETFQNPIKFVYVTQTNVICPDAEGCTPILRRMQSMLIDCFGDVYSNFYIDDGGRAYEGLGWDRMRNEDAIYIHFLTDGRKLPSSETFASFALMLWEGVRIKKIAEEYELVENRHLTRSFQIDLGKWVQWSKRMWVGY